MRGSECHGAISPSCVVMAYTGWDERWKTHEDFRNQQSDGLTHYPGILARSR